MSRQAAARREAKRVSGRAIINAALPASVPEMVCRVVLTLTEAQGLEMARQRNEYGACMVLITREGRAQIIERPQDLMHMFDGASQLAGPGIIKP